MKSQIRAHLLGAFLTFIGGCMTVHEGNATAAMSFGFMSGANLLAALMLLRELKEPPEKGISSNQRKDEHELTPD